MVTVRVYVTLKPALLDSAGRTVAQSLRDLGFGEVEETRVGRLVEIRLTSYDEASVRAMCDKLLANPVIEEYLFEVVS